LIEFVIAEHVRANFPARAGSGNRHKLSETVALASRLAEQAFEETATEKSHPEQIACRRGFSYCCHMRVVATVPEIIALHDFIALNRSTNEVAALRRRIAALGEVTSGLTDEQWGAGYFPCPMLVEGLCSAYSVRPLDCRGYNSTNLAACEAAAKDYLEWDVPRDELLMSVNKSAQAGLLQALAREGYRPRLVELTAGLRIAFEDSTAIDRWIEGENPFAGAELDPSDPEQRAFLPWVPSDELRLAQSQDFEHTRDQ